MMNDDLRALLVNLLSDVIFFILLLLAGWVLYRLLRRHQLTAFFGVREDERRILLRLSDLVTNEEVKNALSTSEAGALKLYTLPIVPFNEVLVASKLRDTVLAARPSLVDRSSIFGQMLLTDINVDISPSGSASEVHTLIDEAASLISLGSTGYNPTSRHIEDRSPKCARFKVPADLSGARYHAEAAITFEEIELKNDAHHHYGFVQRIQDGGVRPDQPRRRTMFYVAGINEYGTVGATKYLMQRWRDLYKRYGADKSFVVLLRFDAEMEQGTVIVEREF